MLHLRRDLHFYMINGGSRPSRVESMSLGISNRNEAESSHSSAAPLHLTRTRDGQWQQRYFECCLLYYFRGEICKFDDVRVG